MVSDTATRLSNMEIKTPNSLIRNHSVLHYSSFAGIVNDRQHTTFDIHFDPSRISPKDLKYFSPGVASGFPGSMQRADYIRLKAGVEGRLTDFDISLFSMGAGDNLAVAMTGNITGLPDYRQARYRIRLDTLRAEREDILEVLPDSAVPSSISLPGKLSLNGQFDGTLHDFGTSLVLQSTQGDISASLEYREGSNGREHYAGKITVDGYDIGQLVRKPDTLGKLSIDGHFSGSSRNFKNPDATFDFTIGRLTALDYTYHDIKLAGTFANHIFNGSASISDTSLVARFDGKASLGDSVPSYDFTLNLKGMDAHAIHLTDQDIRVKGVMRADFTGSNVDSINGFLKAYDIIIVRDGNFYPLDSVIVKATNTREKTELNFHSQFANADYTGSVRFSKLPGLMKDYFGYYFNLQQDTSRMNAREGKFEFQGPGLQHRSSLGGLPAGPE